MNIVAYLYSAPPFRYVGGEMMTYQLLKWASDAGHDVTVIGHTLKTQHIYNGIPIIPWGTNRLFAKKIIRASDVAVTHPELALHIGVANKKIGIVHNLNANTLDGIRRYDWTYLVSNSQYTINELSKKISVNTYLIYPPAIKHKDFNNERFGIFMSNLSEQKGGKEFGAISKVLPEFKFIGVAGGYGNQLDISSDKNFYLVGHGPLEIPMSMAKVVMSLSKSETYGMTVAEATMSHIPCIVTDIPAHREVLGDSCEYVSTKDPVDSIAKKVHGLMTDEQLYAHMRTRAADRAAVLQHRNTVSKETWLGLLNSL